MRTQISLSLVVALACTLLASAAPASRAPSPQPPIPSPGFIAPGVLWLGQQPADVDSATILSRLPAGVHRVMWTTSPNVAPVLRPGGDYFREVSDATSAVASTNSVAPALSYGCSVALHAPWRYLGTGGYHAKGTVTWSSCFNVATINAQSCLRYDNVSTVGCVSSRWSPATSPTHTLAPSIFCFSTAFGHLFATWYIATYFATDGASFTATNQTGNVTLLCED